jgi:hypothetical protein
MCFELYETRNNVGLPFLRHVFLSRLISEWEDGNGWTGLRFVGKYLLLKQTFMRIPSPDKWNEEVENPTGKIEQRLIEADCIRWENCQLPD